MVLPDFITAVRSDEFNINDSGTNISVPYCGVCMNDNHQTSKCIRIEDVEAFTSNGHRNVNHWRCRRVGYSRNPSAEAFGNIHKRNK